MSPDEMRAQCRRYLDQMPEDGLKETMDTLRDYLAFYSTPKVEPRYPETRSVESIYSGTVVRPPLYIDGDDV